MKLFNARVLGRIRKILEEEEGTLTRKSGNKWRVGGVVDELTDQDFGCGAIVNNSGASAHNYASTPSDGCKHLRITALFCWPVDRRIVSHHEYLVGMPPCLQAATFAGRTNASMYRFPRAFSCTSPTVAVQQVHGLVLTPSPGAWTGTG